MSGKGDEEEAEVESPVEHATNFDDLDMYAGADVPAQAPAEILVPASQPPDDEVEQAVNIPEEAEEPEAVPETPSPPPSSSLAEQPKAEAPKFGQAAPRQRMQLIDEHDSPVQPLAANSQPVVQDESLPDLPENPLNANLTAPPQTPEQAAPATPSSQEEASQVTPGQELTPEAVALQLASAPPEGSKDEAETEEEEDQFRLDDLDLYTDSQPAPEPAEGPVARQLGPELEDTQPAEGEEEEQAEGDVQDEPEVEMLSDAQPSKHWPTFEEDMYRAQLEKPLDTLGEAVAQKMQARAEKREFKPPSEQVEQRDEQALQEMENKLVQHIAHDIVEETETKQESNQLQSDVDFAESVADHVLTASADEWVVPPRRARGEPPGAVPIAPVPARVAVPAIEASAAAPGVGIQPSSPVPAVRSPEQTPFPILEAVFGGPAPAPAQPPPAMQQQPQPQSQEEQQQLDRLQMLEQSLRHREENHESIFHQELVIARTPVQHRRVRRFHEAMHNAGLKQDETAYEEAAAGFQAAVDEMNKANYAKAKERHDRHSREYKEEVDKLREAVFQGMIAKRKQQEQLEVQKAGELRIQSAREEAELEAELLGVAQPAAAAVVRQAQPPAAQGEVEAPQPIDVMTRNMAAKLLSLKWMNRSEELRRINDFDVEFLRKYPFKDLFIVRGGTLQSFRILDKIFSQLVLPALKLPSAAKPEARAITLLLHQMQLGKFPDDLPFAKLNEFWKQNVVLQRFMPPIEYEPLGDAAHEARYFVLRMMTIIEAGLRWSYLWRINEVLLKDVCHASFARDLRYPDADSKNPSGLPLIGDRQLISECHTIALGCSVRAINMVCTYIRYLGDEASDDERRAGPNALNSLLSPVFSDLFSQVLHATHCHAAPDGELGGDLESLRLRVERLAALLKRVPLTDSFHGVLEDFLGTVDSAKRRNELAKSRAERFSYVVGQVDIVNEAKREYTDEDTQKPIAEQSVHLWKHTLELHIKQAGSKLPEDFWPACKLMSARISGLARGLWMLSAYNPDQKMCDDVRYHMHALRTVMVDVFMPLFLRYHSKTFAEPAIWQDVGYNVYSDVADMLLSASDDGLSTHNMRDTASQSLWHFVAHWLEQTPEGFEATDNDFSKHAQICAGFLAGASAGFVLRDYFWLEDGDRNGMKKARKDIYSEISWFWSILCKRQAESEAAHRLEWQFYTAQKPQPDKQEGAEEEEELTAAEKANFATYTNSYVSRFMHLLFALHTELRFVRAGGAKPWHFNEVESPMDDWEEEPGGFNLLSLEQAVGTATDWNTDTFGNSIRLAVVQVDQDRAKSIKDKLRLVDVGEDPSRAGLGLGLGAGLVSPGLSSPVPDSRLGRAFQPLAGSVPASVAGPRQPAQLPADPFAQTELTLVELLDNLSYCVNRIHSWYGYVLLRRWRTGRAKKSEQTAAGDLSTVERQFLDLPAAGKQPRRAEHKDVAAPVSDADMMLLCTAAAQNVMLQARQQETVTPFEWPGQTPDVKWVPLVDAKQPSSIEVRLQEMINGTWACRGVVAEQKRSIVPVSRGLHVAAHLINVTGSVEQGLLQSSEEEGKLSSIEPLNLDDLPATRDLRETTIFNADEILPQLRLHFVVLASKERLTGDQAEAVDDADKRRTNALLFVTRLLHNTRLSWEGLSASDFLGDYHWKLDLLIECIVWMTGFGAISRATEQKLFDELNTEPFTLRLAASRALNTLAEIAEVLRNAGREKFVKHSTDCVRLACALLLGRRHLLFANRAGVDNARRFIHFVMLNLTISAADSDRLAPPFTPSCFNPMPNWLNPESVPAAKQPEPEVKKRSPKKQRVSGVKTRARIRAIEQGAEAEPDWQPQHVEAESKRDAPLAEVKSPAAKKAIRDVQQQERQKGAHAVTFDELKTEADAYSWTALFFALTINATGGDGLMVWEYIEDGSETKKVTEPSVFDPNRLPLAAELAEAAQAQPRTGVRPRRPNATYALYKSQLKAYEDEGKRSKLPSHVFVSLSDKIRFKNTRGDPEDVPHCYMLGLFSGRHFNVGDVITEYGGQEREVTACRKLDRSDKSHIQELPNNAPVCLDGKAYAEAYDVSVLKDDPAEYHKEFMRTPVERRQFLPVRVPEHVGDKKSFMEAAVNDGQGYMINAGTRSEINCKAVFEREFTFRADDLTNFPRCFIVATKPIQPFEELYRKYSTQDAADFIALERKVQAQRREDLEAMQLDEDLKDGDTLQQRARKQKAANEVAAMNEAEKQPAAREHLARAAKLQADKLSADLAKAAKLTGIDDWNEFQMSMFRDIVELKESGRRGLGLFAKQTLPPATELCRFDGKKLSRQQLAKLSEKERDRVMMFSTTSQEPGATWVLPQFPLNVAGWFNHPFPDERANCVVGVSNGNKVLTTYEVKAGDELLIDYDYAYWTRVFFNEDWDTAEEDVKKAMVARIKQKMAEMAAAETKERTLQWQDAQSLQGISVRDPPAADAAKRAQDNAAAAAQAKQPRKWEVAYNARPQLSGIVGEWKLVPEDEPDPTDRVVELPDFVVERIWEQQRFTDDDDSEEGLDPRLLNEGLFIGKDEDSKGFASLKPMTKVFYASNSLRYGPSGRGEQPKRLSSDSRERLPDGAWYAWISLITKYKWGLPEDEPPTHAARPRVVAAAAQPKQSAPPPPAAVHPKQMSTGPRTKTTIRVPRAAMQSKAALDKYMKAARMKS